MIFKYLNFIMMCGVAFAGRPSAAAAAINAGDDVVILVVTSARSFDPALPALKFAVQDGSRFADIMSSVGRVPKDHIVFVNNGATRDLPLAVEQVNGILARCLPGAGCSSKFIFYYSGHSDEFGLHLRDGLVGKNQLHAALAAVNAVTKIVLLDSCFSGSLTRKGVQQAPVFELPKAEFDQPSGSIFISASSARDYSYESDELRGSVFTYYLVAGLSGEADVNGAGVVTVDELYRYVYREVKMHSLMIPSATTQTPEFVSRLEGRGAITLTYPGETNANLLLGSDLAGKVTIASLGGIQMFTVDKQLGVKKNLQLPAGRYAVSVKQGFRSGLGEVQLRPKKLALLSGDELSWQDRTLDVTRKGRAASETGAAVGTELGVHQGYVGNQGPGAALALVGTRPAGVGPPGALRWLGRLNGETHSAHEGSDYANLTLFGATFGAAYELANPWSPLPQSLVLSAAVGATQQQQDWHYTNRPDQRFRTVLPTLNLGLAYGVRWPSLPGRYFLEARRDFLQGDDVRTGRRVLAGNYLGLAIDY